MGGRVVCVETPPKATSELLWSTGTLYMYCTLYMYVLYTRCATVYNIIHYTYCHRQ